MIPLTWVYIKVIIDAFLKYKWSYISQSYLYRFLQLTFDMAELFRSGLCVFPKLLLCFLIKLILQIREILIFKSL